MLSDNYKNAISTIKKQLRDFAAAEANALDLPWTKGVTRSRVDISHFPVPTLILFVLHEICEFPLGHRGEKTHWILPFSYRRANYAIALEKFGVSLYSNDNEEARRNEIIRNLSKAIKHAEKHILSKIAKEQISTGNITIENLFHKLNNQYLYFRQTAHSDFSHNIQDESSPNIEINKRQIHSLDFSDLFSGSYNTLAMIDAYFSRLEHILVLSLPFCSYNRTQDNLSEYIGKNWKAKMSRILDIKKNPMKKYYDDLIFVKEKYRNTFAHGGFEKNGASFYFHLTNYGSIPANISGRMSSVHFNLTPIDLNIYESICTLFDEFDSFLQSNALKTAWQYVQSGLHMSFDETSIAKLLAFSKDTESFERWLKYRRNLMDVYINADY